MHVVDGGMIDHLAHRESLFRGIADGKFHNPVQVLIAKRR
jgi:hypothetical protein